MPSPVVTSCEAREVSTSSPSAANMVAIVSLAIVAVAMAYEVFLERECDAVSFASWYGALERFEVIFLVSSICRLVLLEAIMGEA